jgi:hypothetical protein
MQPVNPSLFNLFASKNPQYWTSIEGCEIIHKVWGRCIIEKVDLPQKAIIVLGRKVALEYFKDEIFGGLCLPSEIVEKVSSFEKQKHEEEQLIIRRQIEEELKKNLEATIRQKARLEKEKVEREKQAEIDRLRLEKAQQQEAKRIAQIEAEKQSRLKVAQERSRLVSEFCSTKRIVYLIHFTRIENLKRILQQGLINRKELSRLPESERPIFNDQERFDGHIEAVCLSISFPNYQMFYKLNKDKPDDWVVLLLDSSILWDLDCAFCQTNAASSIISRIPLEQRKTLKALVQMFNDEENVSRDELAIPANFTTNPQAEVLVFGTIPTNYIRCVNFRSISAMKAWQNLNSYPKNLSLVASDIYFKPRCDWPKWQKSQDNHNVPQEFDEFEIIDL